MVSGSRTGEKPRQHADSQAADLSQRLDFTHILTRLLLFHTVAPLSQSAADAGDSRRG